MTKVTKVCKECGLEKELSEFYPLPKGKQGVHPKCNICMRLYAAKKRAERTAEQKAEQAAYQKDYYIWNREAIAKRKADDWKREQASKRKA